MKLLCFVYSVHKEKYCHLCGLHFKYPSKLIRHTQTTKHEVNEAIDNVKFMTLVPPMLLKSVFTQKNLRSTLRVHPFCYTTSVRLYPVFCVYTIFKSTHVLCMLDVVNIGINAC